nr:immunoglobulin light chain junction region [Macaca mulatta]
DYSCSTWDTNMTTLF